MSKVTILSKPNRIVIASKGVQGAPGPQGEQGIQGPKGDTGDVTPEALAARDAAVDAADAASQSADAAAASESAAGGSATTASAKADEAAASADLAEQARLLGATIGFATKADMDASLAHPDGTLALVTNDPTAENNGAYRKTGASGSGSWVQSADRVTGLEQFQTSLDAYALEVETSKNLYNPAGGRDGFSLNSTGNITIAAGRKFSGFIPVTPGQTYVLSSVGPRAGRSAFYSSATDTGAVVSGSFNALAANPLVVTAPAGANFFAFNVVDGTVTVEPPMQFEQASAPTDYEPYHTPRRVVRADSIRGANNPVELGARLDSVEDAFATSRNLYDPAGRVEGRLVSNNGSIGIAAGWAHSGFIPVTAGQTYTISADGEKRTGLAFYSSVDPNGADYVAGSFSADAVHAGAPMTVTAPAGAQYVVFNVESPVIPEPSAIQIEQGAQATPYIPFGKVYVPAESVPELAQKVAALEAGIGPEPTTTLTFNGGGTVVVKGRAGADVIERGVIPFTAPSMWASQVLNPVFDKVNGVTVRTMGDDAAPYRTMNPSATIGANHGYFHSELTATAHGKTAADVGSVWSSGGAQYVILGVKDANTLRIAPRVGNGVVPAGAFTHVSGATNTAGFTGSAPVDNLQWYAAVVNRRCDLLVDGILVESRTGELPFSQSVEFHESYDVLARETAIEWFIANPGTAAVQAQGTPAFSVSIVHRFDREGGYTLFSDFIARETVELRDIMFTQAARMSVSGDGDVDYYVPKALPFTHEGTPYNWAMIDSSDTSSWTTRADITPARAEVTGLLVDRLVMLSDSYGFAIGYAPVQDASPDVRRLNATVKALQISSTNGKVYPYAIDMGPQVLAKGDAFKAVAYRNIFKRDAARTDSYVVRMQGRAFVYADWHNVTKVDRVPIPADLVGRPFTVVEVRNATLMSESLTSGLLVDVAATSDYAYLIVEVG